MKFRKDFVTNSSSSSFLAVDVESEDFVELLSRFANGLHKILGDCLILDLEKNKMELEYEDGYCPDVPESLKGFVDSFTEFIEATCENYDEEEVQEVIELIEKLRECREELADLLRKGKVNWEFKDCGWGGDDTSRYDKNTYSEEWLNEVYDAILREHKELKCYGDITDEIFYEYVGNKSSNEEYVFNYDGQNESLRSCYYLE